MLIRQTVQNTLLSLRNFFKNYENVNYMNMNLDLKVPFVWHIISDIKNSKIVLNPTIQNTKIIINDIISEIAESLHKVPRVEKFLFENFDFSNKSYHNLIKKNEDQFIEIENFFNNLITLNSERAIM